MKNQMKAFVATLATCVVLFAMPALAGTRVVNCDNGDSLQKAIESGTGSAALLEIQLFGTCEETFSFTRDKVTITGDGNTTIAGHIRVFASDQVVFSNLTITGPGPGVMVFNGRARFIGVNVIGNDDTGVSGRQGASINFVNSRISDNRGPFGILLEHAVLVLNNSDVFGNWGVGVMVTKNSTLTLRNGAVHSNFGPGIGVALSSVIEVSNSEVRDNGEAGITMRTSSAGEVYDTRIHGNPSQGIEMTGNSTLDFFGGEIRENRDHGAIVSEHAFLQLIDTHVYDNTGHGLIIRRDGGVLAEGSTRIETSSAYFDVVCEGDEASIEFGPDAFVGPMDCDGASY